MPNLSFIIPFEDGCFYMSFTFGILFKNMKTVASDLCRHTNACRKSHCQLLDFLKQQNKTTRDFCLIKKTGQRDEDDMQLTHGKYLFQLDFCVLSTTLSGTQQSRMHSRSPVILSFSHQLLFTISRRGVACR